KSTSRGCDHPRACVAKVAPVSTEPSHRPTPSEPPTAGISIAKPKPHRSEARTLALLNVIPPSPPERPFPIPGSRRRGAPQLAAYHGNQIPRSLNSQRMKDEG